MSKSRTHGSNSQGVPGQQPTTFVLWCPLYISQNVLLWRSKALWSLLKQAFMMFLLGSVLDKFSFSHLSLIMNIDLKQLVLHSFRCSAFQFDFICLIICLCWPLLWRFSTVLFYSFWIKAVIVVAGVLNA